MTITQIFRDTIAELSHTYYSHTQDQEAWLEWYTKVERPRRVAKATKTEPRS